MVEMGAYMLRTISIEANPIISSSHPSTNHQLMTDGQVQAATSRDTGVRLQYSAPSRRSSKREHPSASYYPGRYNNRVDKLMPASPIIVILDFPG